MADPGGCHGQMVSVEILITVQVTSTVFTALSKLLQIQSQQA